VWPIIISIPGKPATAGSHRSFVSRTTKKVVTIHDNSRYPAWRKAAGVYVSNAMKSRKLKPIQGAVCLGVVAFFERPASHYGKGRNCGVLKPSAPIQPTSHSLGDVSKIVRALEDSLNGIAWLDDSQICLGVQSKYWVPRGISGSLLAWVGPIEMADRAMEWELDYWRHGGYSNVGEIAAG